MRNWKYTFADFPFVRIIYYVSEWERLAFDAYLEVRLNEDTSYDYEKALNLKMLYGERIRRARPSTIMSKQDVDDFTKAHTMKLKEITLSLLSEKINAIPWHDIGIVQDIGNVQSK